MQVRSVMPRRRLDRGARDERGVVAVVIALAMTAILIITAMVLDFGLVRVDQQVNKSAADSAALAGLSAMATGDDGVARPFAGVCAALRYLQQNNDRFATVSDTTGSWTTGTDVATGDGCTDTTLLDQSCVPTDQSTWAKFTWTGTWDGDPLKVQIQSGYQIAGAGWSEDSLPALATDQSDGAQGCNQLAVIITENRKPGLGSLATTSDLVSTVRSVGRVKPGPGKDAPAMLLLDRHGCEVISNTSGGFIHVLGGQSASGNTQAGSIHADTDASQCSSSPHPKVFYGGGSNAIVAYGAPLPDGSPDPDKPGVITSLATYLGSAPDDTIVDSDSNVYATDGVDPTGALTAAKLAPAGRKLVTRSIVDDRYLGLGTPATGVTEAVTNAQAAVFSKPSGYFTAANGWKQVGCSPTAADLSGVTAATKLYVACSSFSGTPTPINAGTVVFAGSIKGSVTASLPNATHVYIFGDPTKDAVSLGTGDTFSMHTVGADGTTNLDGGGHCASGQRSNDKATLIVKAGDLKANGGLLQLCRTTVLMMGGRPDACLPTTSGTPPSGTPCAGGTGDGQLALAGGSNIDWTAPNALLRVTDDSGNPTPEAIAAWTDPNGPEDLALWDESAGFNSNPTFSMGGSGSLHTVGVFMVPNAAPFTIGGNSAQNLVDAQYIASDIALNGGAQLTMKVDPDAAVTLPGLPPIGLVR